MNYPILTCTPKSLPRSKWIEAAKEATRINPVNHPPIERLVKTLAGFQPNAQHLAVLTTKFWHTGGVKLGVAFLDNPPMALKQRILDHINALAKPCNVKFTLSTAHAQVRIARDGGPNVGAWPYHGPPPPPDRPGEPALYIRTFT